MIRTLISLVFPAFIVFMGGCSAPNPSESYNETFKKNKSPVRMVKDPSFKNKNGVRYHIDWAGKEGKSIINDVYRKRLFQGIQKLCGYGEKAFMQARIVQHTFKKNGDIVIEEVWLFHDPKSHRKDKVSGLTIYMEYDKKKDITKSSVYGNCHTQQGMSITFTD